MKLGIIGYGIVGKATHIGLLKNSQVIIHDINLGTTLEDVAVCEYVFLCIPTDNQDSIRILIDTIKTVKSNNSDCKIIIRSTVPIGTCGLIEKEINDKIFYFPEFLRERMWQEDCLNRPIIVGSDNQAPPSWLQGEDCVFCSLEEAELLKMFSNNLGTMRIAFGNHFYDLAQTIGADYNKVKDTYFKVAHTQTYLEVPGPDGGRGFGGKCLPKDLNFLIDTFKNLGIEEHLFTAVRDDNRKWPKKS
jgi:UDPglucose 6-dehydrogenase